MNRKLLLIHKTIRIPVVLQPPSMDHSSKVKESEIMIPIQFSIYASVASKNNGNSNQRGISFTLSLHYKASSLISEKIIKTIVKSSVLRVLHDWGYIVYFIQVTPYYQAFISFEQAAQQIIEKKMQFFLPNNTVNSQSSKNDDHDLQTQVLFSSERK